MCAEASSGEAPDEMEKLRQENARLKLMNDKLAKELEEALSAVIASEAPAAGTQAEPAEDDPSDEALRKRLFRLCGQKDSRGWLF